MKQLKDPPKTLRVGLTKPNVHEQRLAIVTIGETAADTLLQASRVQIGLAKCKVRRKELHERCFCWLGYGHKSYTYKGPDRSKKCYGCGGEGHKAADSEGIALCFLCPEDSGKPEAREHVDGSRKCPTFIAALTEKKMAVIPRDYPRQLDAALN